MVLVDSLKQKLLDLDAMVHGNHVCVALEGCSGCGKTAVLQALSQLHGRTEGDGLVTIHLGEQVDGKASLYYLYGRYGLHGLFSLIISDPFDSLGLELV